MRALRLKNPIIRENGSSVTVEIRHERRKGAASAWRRPGRNGAANHGAV